MADSSNGPSLEQYPGYFPAAKPPFWSRLKVGLAAGVFGLVVGASGSGTSEDVRPAAASTPDAVSSASVEQAVDEATEELQDEIQERDDLLDKQEQVVEQKTDKVKAVRRTLVSARKEAKASLAKAVAQALSKERARVAALAPPAPAPTPAPAPKAPAPAASTGTDPRFSYCYEANDAGYGEYVRGKDPEYDWYRDNDNDGIVCEF
ncbi:excalibur calcium-binding domain-containing protein [Nocardioides donggukensis]|nr:excalibur calcium-binding domain-containing protein [Nocardioides donggukensis]